MNAPRPDIRFHHHLWENGYDPIGASDIIAAAMWWLRAQPEEWIEATTPAEWLDAFEASERARDEFLKQATKATSQEQS